jgi:hypothetical protein
MKLLALFTIALGVGFAQRIDGSFERTLKVTGFVELELTTDSGGISVVPGPPGTVRIRGILRGSNNWLGLNRGNVADRIRQLEAHPPIDQSGNSIRVLARNRDMLKDISMRLEVEVPRDSRLRARADSGGIDVRGIKGPSDCATDSGGIRVTDIDGEVKAAADSGGIRISRVNGPVYARADSGGIDALEIAGTVDVETDSGGVRVSQTTPAAIRARTDSGGADITLARTGGYDIRAYAESGRVSARDVAVAGPVSRKQVNGKLRGGGPVVDVRADSGNIDIR